MVMAEIEPIYDNDNTHISRVTDSEMSEVFYVATLVDKVTPLRLAILMNFMPYDAVLDDIEMVRGVTSFQFVVA